MQTRSKTKKRKATHGYSTARYTKLMRPARRNLGVVYNAFPSANLLPDRMITKMRFFGKITYDAISATDESHDFFWNQMYDPLGAEGATKYNGFDNVKDMYRNHCVIDTTIKCTYANDNEAPMILTTVPWCENQTAPAAPFGSAEGAVSRFIPFNTGGGTGLAASEIGNHYVIRKMTMSKITGQRNLTSTGNGFAVVDSANVPTKFVSLKMIIQPVLAGSTTFSGVMYIEAVNTVVWWGRQGIQDTA